MMLFRSPLGIALLFTLALAGWLFSRPIQELLAGHDGPPTGPVAGAPPAAGAPRMTVRAVESAARPIAPELVVNGHTEAVRSVQLKAETGGRVVATPVAEGAMVEAGALVTELDLRDRASRVGEMEAAVAQRELEYEAARKLGAKQFQSETQVAQARALVEAARAAVHEARLDLEHVTVEAPFAGVLERRMVEAGDYVEPGDPVAEVIEQDPFLVVGDAPETMVGRLEVGKPGTAVLADGRTVAGRLRYVASRADADTRTYRVELEVANPGGRLPAGMSARLVIREPEVAAHRVSAAALVLADDGTIGIKAVDEGGTVRFFPAVIAKAETDAVWLAGLPARLQVITTGQGFVAAGEKVDVELVPDEAPAAAAVTARAPA
jgi:membrane fusion protein, multidrug efflux system